MMRLQVFVWLHCRMVIQKRNVPNVQEMLRAVKEKVDDRAKKTQHMLCSAALYQVSQITHTTPLNLPPQKTCLFLQASIQPHSQLQLPQDLIRHVLILPRPAREPLELNPMQTQ